MAAAELSSSGPSSGRRFQQDVPARTRQESWNNMSKACLLVQKNANILHLALGHSDTMIRAASGNLCTVSSSKSTRSHRHEPKRLSNLQKAPAAQHSLASTQLLIRTSANAPAQGQIVYACCLPAPHLLMVYTACTQLMSAPALLTCTSLMLSRVRLPCSLDMMIQCSNPWQHLKLLTPAKGCFRGHIEYRCWLLPGPKSHYLSHHSHQSAWALALVCGPQTRQ